MKRNVMTLKMGHRCVSMCVPVCEGILKFTMHTPCDIAHVIAKTALTVDKSDKVLCQAQSLPHLYVTLEAPADLGLLEKVSKLSSEEGEFSVILTATPMHDCEFFIPGLDREWVWEKSWRDTFKADMFHFLNSKQPPADHSFGFLV